MSESRASYRIRSRAGTLKDGSQSEKSFSQQVVDYARLHGWMVQRHWSEKFSPSGWPDMTFCRPANVYAWHPRLIFAELKSLHGKLTLEQETWLAALKAAGVPTYTWRPTPEDWREIEQVLGGER